MNPISACNPCISVLHCPHSVQLERRFSGFDSAPKAVLASFLALILLVAGTASASHALHQTLHSGNPGSGHFCLLCSLAKGEVGAAEVAIVATLPLISLCFGLCPPLSLVLPASDYRLSPSRAPPRH